MSSRKTTTWPILTVIVAAFVVFIALPQNMKQWAPGFIKNAQLHFGLDLAGGTQLDFRISEQEMKDQIALLEQQSQALKARGGSAEEIALLDLQLQSIQEQQKTVVEAIRTVLERRINALGVSEAIITPSYIGNEKHLLVECPGVVDTQECIQTVGKTIKLEFKEQFVEPTEEHVQGIRSQVAAALERTVNGEDFTVVGEDLGDEIGISYVEEGVYFRSQLPEELSDLWNKPPGDRIYQHDVVILSNIPSPEGEIVQQEVPGIFLSQVVRERTQTGRTVLDGAEAFDILAKQEENASAHHYEQQSLDSSIIREVRGTLREMAVGDINTVQIVDGGARILYLEAFEKGREEMEASHILIAYAGATSAVPDVQRSKEEAQKLALDLRKKIEAGESFVSLAKQYSDGPSGAQGGSLGTFDRTTMVPAFSDAAFALVEGEISQPVETAFGFHIIRADVGSDSKPDIATFHEVHLSGETAATRAAALMESLQKGEITKTEDVVHLRTIFFNLTPTGWKDTQLDGKHFRTATVTLDPITNIPVVQISFDDEGAQLFEDLTRVNIGKPIAIFVGGDLVSAPVVQAEISGGIAVITGMQNFEAAKSLAQDLNTGAIPAPIYLAGQRTVEATLGAKALETSLKAALIGIVLLMAYMIVMYRLLGVIASIALGTYALLFFALLKLPLFLFSSNYIVLTLAGMAGIILSIGMAVDANVLIFERLREELSKGKVLSNAVDTGFKRAWPSIRDGNVSTLITCFILFTIGTSIVKGFAITLGMGVLLSMFSAIVVTRWLMNRVAETKYAEQPALFGVTKNDE